MFNRRDDKKKPVRAPARKPDKFRIVADARHGDMLLGKLINKVMRSGKKSLAEKIVYGALETLEAKTSQPGLDVFHTALDNIKPIVEVKSRRVGGSTYQVPIEVSLNRGVSLGIRWLVDFARGRGEKTMRERLASEILDAFNNRGGAVKKREDTHRMAEANKAFAHFRW
ncbi:MAG: 30S ribosomal protein S7 [Deltaproteobacteria bacterium]|nr:30S ribosomal protein S7 [Deltaproteobacteria bacterium]